MGKKGRKSSDEPAIFHEPDVEPGIVPELGVKGKSHIPAFLDCDSAFGNGTDDLCAWSDMVDHRRPDEDRMERPIET
jgi:hypothetical protein